MLFLQQRVSFNTFIVVKKLKTILAFTKKEKPFKANDFGEN